MEKRKGDFRDSIVVVCGVSLQLHPALVAVECWNNYQRRVLG